MSASTPSFLLEAHDAYIRCSQLGDDYFKFKALESTFATLVKYLGTTFSVMALDKAPPVGAEAASLIFSSSSLGGWIDAIEKVCQKATHFETAQQSHCKFFSQYKNHPDKSALKNIERELTTVTRLLNERGYRLDFPKSTSIVRALRYLVQFRNKLAHGALDIPFFVKAEPAYKHCLAMLLELVPFDMFEFWGHYGNYSVSFSGRPIYLDERPKYTFWITSNLLSGGVASSVPFVQYQEEARSVFFLNDEASEDEPESQFIDYTSGKVIYRKIDFDWRTINRAEVVTQLQWHRYLEYRKILSNEMFEWVEVPISESSLNVLSDQSAIYVFHIDLDILSDKMRHILYVGKTGDIRTRLRSYLRVQKGYDESRPAISRMFELYGDAVKFRYALTPKESLALIERAVYEAVRPEFNLIAPAQ